MAHVHLNLNVYTPKRGAYKGVSCNSKYLKSDFVIKYLGMNRQLIISLCTIGLYLFTSTLTFGQVVICGDKQSSHPIDIRVFQLRDSINQTGIDTIILYRHWYSANGYNGYGKIIWLDKGQCFQYKITLENNANNEIHQTKISKLSTDSLFAFVFSNHIDTITTNPTKQDIKISHDARHFVQVSCNDKTYCYIITGLLVQFNPENLRAKFIRMLADENVSSVTIDGERTKD
jgi:hypothetical protein